MPVLVLDGHLKPEQLPGFLLVALCDGATYNWENSRNTLCGSMSRRAF